MRSGSQSNRAPGPLAASPACPASPLAGSNAACFHPDAAAKILASHRFPTPPPPTTHRGPFIRGKCSGAAKASGPREIAAARQHRPAVALPPADMLLIQQALQLVVVSVTLRSQSVSGAPIAEQHRETQPVAVQDRPMTTSFPPLGRPVNHPEAEYAP